METNFITVSAERTAPLAPAHALLAAGLTCLATLWGTGSSSAAEVVVDTGIRYQVIEGFGTCLKSWQPRMDQFYRTPATVATYAEDLRFNFLRCNLWGDGTIPKKENPAQISHQDPAFAARDPRTPVFISFAKAVQQLNPHLKVIGTVWSPPAWMKENDAIADKGSGAATPPRSSRGNLPKGANPSTR